MADILSTGISGLMAYQRALDTTSQNIANANTAGYTRQRVDLVSRPGQGTGAGYVGSGVDIASIVRVGDSMLSSRLRGDASASARADVFSSYANRLDQMLSSAETGLAQPLQGFLDAASVLAQQPTSTAARQSYLGEAQTLAARFSDTQDWLDALEGELNGGIRASVDEINTLSTQIAELNERIALATGAFGQPPNDLLDQRDQALQQLAGQVGISTVAQDDGSVNVFTASGQSLVLGQHTTELRVEADAFDSGRLDVVYGSSTRLTDALSGGELGGLLDTRREVLDPARRELGRLAVGLSDTLNAQHAQGMDAYGDLGGELFAEIHGEALASTRNTGSAEVAVNIADVAQLDGSEYLLRHDGAGWQLTRNSDGSSVALAGSGSAGDPLRAAGLELVVDGTASAGDQFWIRPTANAASQLQVAISDPQRVAAAAPVGVSAATSNTGAARASAPVVDDAADPALLDGVEITFLDAGTYQINGSGSHPYVSGDEIAVNGWRMVLEGVPAAGDRFSVSAAGANSGDNRNALALAQVGDLGALRGGVSLQQAQAAFVTGTGSLARQASQQSASQARIYQQSQDQLASVGGVNLDEEAANLLRFQQAYQAAARVIQVADSMFQTLLQATGR